MRPDPDPAHDVALDHLLAAAERLQGVGGSDELADAPRLWRLLRAIADGERTVAELARRVHATRAEVQPMADALVLAGLARYEPNPSPRRAQRVARTAEGTRMLASVDASARAWLLATNPTDEVADAPGELDGMRRFLLTVIACADATSPSTAPVRSSR